MILNKGPVFAPQFWLSQVLISMCCTHNKLLTQTLLHPMFNRAKGRPGLCPTPCLTLLHTLSYPASHPALLCFTPCLLLPYTLLDPALVCWHGLQDVRTSSGDAYGTDQSGQVSTSHTTVMHVGKVLWQQH